MTYLHARIWAPRIPASISRMRRLPAIVLIAALAALAPATAGAADLFNNWNTGAVQNAPTGVTVFTLAAPAHITELVTYHWNNGRGLPALPPVTITLTGATGATFGPFTAVGSPGTNGVLNVNWTATVSLDLAPGTWTVIDSQRATWSQNAQSHHSGFAKVLGTLNTPGPGPGPEPGPQPGPAGFEYAVKFVCGSPVVPVVAPGEYFTAINVHNPAERPVSFRKKVAIALPGEKAGRVSKFFEAQLKGDEAFEIDCQDILKHADAQGFLKGFVVLETPSELDVVAVYTAGHPQVETLDIERVPPRPFAAGTVVGPADPSHCPAGSGGDPVGGVGCCCNHPKPGGGFWPDCKSGLVCVGNASGPGIPTNLFGVCATHASANIFLDPPPPPDASQPPFCGAK